MLNLTNNVAKQKYLRSMTRQQIILEKSFAKRLSPIIHAQFHASARVIRGGSRDIDSAIKLKRADLIKEFSRMYRQTAVTLKENVDKNLKKGVSIPEIKSGDDTFWSTLNFWIDTYAGKKVTRVNEATKKTIEKIIKKGMENEDSNAIIAEKIDAISEIADKSRAATISRTETHGAAIMAVDSSIRDYLGDSLSTKEWVAALDERTRDDHAEVNGDIVNENESFSVGEDDMEYPGDPSASAGNVINCRCVVIYHTKTGDIESEGLDNE
jgi:uncharacterized protein with gpF-like domain